MEKNFDNKLKKLFNKNIYIPQKVTNRIQTSLNEEKKEVPVHMYFSKMIAGIASVILIGTGGVFAAKALTNQFSAMQEAKENGFYEEVGGDYIEHDGLGIRIANYFIDIRKVGITFEMQADEVVDEVRMYRSTEQLNNPSTSDLIRFIDENGNEIPYSFTDAIGVHSGPDFLMSNEPIDNQHFQTSFIQYPNEDYHKARQMKVTIKKVVTKKDGKEKEYLGDWEFIIDIADRFLDNSNKITYQASIGDTVVGEAQLSGTQLVLRIQSKEAVEANQNHPEVITLPSKNDFEKYIPRLLGEDRQELENVFSSSHTSEDIGYTEYIFNISKYSAQNAYKVVIEGMVINLTK